MNKQQILEAIEEYIKGNGLQEITGPILNMILAAMAKIIPDDTMLTSSFGGLVNPNSNLIVTPGQQKWFFADPGTYANADNITFEANKLNILSYDGVHFSGLEIDLPNVSISSDLEFQNKISSKAFSPKQLFDVIGNFAFDSGSVDLTMTLPTDFDINSANSSDLPAMARYTFDSSLYSDFEFFKSIDVKYVKLGTWNIYVYDKSNLNSPIQTIPISVTSLGVKNVVFNPPIDAKNNMIFISEGVGYYAKTGATGAMNIINGTLTVQNGVYIGIKLYGTKTVNKSKTIVEQIEELKNNSTFIFDNNLYKKEKDQINAIIGESANSSFVINNTGLTISSPGTGNGVILNKQYNLNERFLQLKVKLSSDTKFYLGTQNSESNVGKAYSVIDSGAKSITIFNLDSTTSVATTNTFPFSITNDREYVVRFYKLNDLTKVELIDPITGNRAAAQISQLGQFDRYKFGFLSSTSNPIISSLSVHSIISLRPFIAFYGDSITEGNSVGVAANNPYYKDRFANLISEKLNMPYYVSGRSAGTIDGVLSRMQSEIPYLRPKYVFVTIGTNGGNTETKLNQLVDYCESFGCKVILNLIPLYDGTTASKNAMIQGVVDARKLLSVKMNVATSLNSDGVTKDNSLFANESGTLIHPNVAGNIKIYERALIDVAEIFQEVGIY
ncbi:SGNH/GDSL hydrolase family protein [Chryseobacterium flavum]|uniref:SGNH/GDSL hydrolase family protein n=1 Tax=Chryseobacterium flavum TaxID=415851 RepID=UPI0028AB4938|nr:SGNH/GDSL hydrolase family protein [Chryseobacterium flavum]